MKPTTHRYLFEPPCGKVVQVALPPPSPPDYADVRAFRYDDVVVGFVRYPAVTEEEERISIPLQTMCGAIFDAILFHIVETVSGTKWQSLRTEMCEALNLKKTDHTLGVLERTYGDSDVIFLQEVAKEFIAKAQSDSLLSDYAIIAPAELGSRDQNSVVFLSKALFDITSVVEISKTVEANCNTKGLAPGDIIAITVNDRLGNMFMFASFHGDTNGLQTIPVVTAIHKTHSELRQNNVKLLMVRAFKS